MSFSRRNFIKSGAIAAAAAGFLLDLPIRAWAQDQVQSGPLMGYFQIPDETRQNPLLSFRRSTFEPYVGGIFTGRDALGRTVQLRLTKVTEYKPKANTRISTSPARTTDSFSLLFQASKELPPFTSIHVIDHGALGRFDLFLVRSRGTGRQIFYEAVFNHV